MSNTTQLLRFITAGSVDDGKSTLIGRLLFDAKSIFEDQYSAISMTSRKRGMASVDLSLLTDGLQAEREQGITIDVAYRYFATPRRKFIIGDTPGHEQYTRNMVTAASTANLIIILVDARRGVLVQTRRHTYLASLVGIPHIVLAVNKMDMVEYSESRYREICDEYLAFAAQLGLHNVTCIPLSALFGDMLVDRGDNLPWYQGPTLMEWLENVEMEHDLNTQDFRYPVQWICRPQTGAHHDFRGYMGRIVSGEVSVGDSLTALPSGKTSHVLEISTYDGQLESAHAPQSIAIRLTDEIDISRGDMLVKSDNLPTVSTEFEAMLCWLSETPLDRNRKYLVKHTTRTVKCLFTGIDYRVDVNTLERHARPEVNMNDIVHAGIRVQQPLAIDSYRKNRACGSFIVIDEITNDTVAAGMID